MYQKKTLAIDCRMISMSGIGTYIQHIVPGLVKSERFVIYCLGYEELKSYEWAGKVIIKFVNAKILSLSEQLELSLKIPKCDLYWTPNWNIPLLPIRAKSRLATIHDVYHLANDDRFSKTMITIVKIFMQRLSSYPKIITVSNFSKNEICRFTNIKADKIEVIPLAPKDLAKPDNNPKNTKSYILYVGNVKPHKNLKFALDAFYMLEKVDLQFIIVGKREGFITSENSMNDIIFKLGSRVSFTGSVNDGELACYYKNASLFLFPSLYEGFGLPILEAMQAKIPILASNAASIPEVGGEAVHYFNPNDVNDLLMKLRMFFNDELPDLTLNYKIHLENFSWQRVIAAHIKVIQEN